MVAIAMAAAALRKSDGRAIALAEHGLPSWLVPTLWVAAVECVDIYAYAHVRTHLYRTVIDSIRYRAARDGTHRVPQGARGWDT